MKLIQLLFTYCSASADSETIVNVNLGNLLIEAMEPVNTDKVPTTRVTGSEEHIRTLHLASGWRYDHAYLGWHGYHALLVDLGVNDAISVIERVFPGIELEVIDCDALDEARLKAEELARLMAEEDVDDWQNDV